MDNKEIKELLEKQLVLLSEQSKDCTREDLAELTYAMIALVDAIAVSQRSLRSE